MKRNSELRTEVLNRDGYQCVDCGARHTLVVHHTSYPDEDTAENLITVCRSCHGIEHSNNPELIMPGYKTIVISQDTKEELKKWGLAGDSMDDALQTVLKEAAKKR